MDEVLRIYQETGSTATLALNIKADGLQEMLKPMLEKYGVKNYFFFDMSVCDTILYVEQHLKFASRSSEFEPYLPFY